ncbi:hypothetical protein [Alysiella crassa]|nr:hypothetical protein [Alysiella crassa]
MHRDYFCLFQAAFGDTVNGGNIQPTVFTKGSLKNLFAYVAE